MKMEELKGKSVDQLKEMHANLKKEQFNLRFQASTGELENVGRFRQVRRDIARIMTAMSQNKKAS